MFISTPCTARSKSNIYNFIFTLILFYCQVFAILFESAKDSFVSVCSARTSKAAFPQKGTQKKKGDKAASFPPTASLRNQIN